MSNLFIQKLANFGELDSAALEALKKATADPEKVRAKTDLIREGDRPGPVFVILDGWACRYKILPNGTRQILAYLMPGDCCDLHTGLLASMDHGIQTVTVASVATIERDAMDQMMDRHPKIAQALYVAQLVDEGTMRSWITSMGRRTSIERVAHLMCELYLRARSIGIAKERQFALPLSQIMLADSLGMTPVHLNRVLKKLRTEGTMEMARGSLKITDPEKLVSIAGFDENYLHRRLSNAA